MHISNYIPKVKICCILSIEEARIAIEVRASAIGLVSEMPSGPGVITENQIREIAKNIPTSIDTFLLTSRQSVEDIVKQHECCQTTTIQFVDSIQPVVYKKLRLKLPGVKFVQVIHVIDEDSIEEAKLVSPYVDAFLLDSGNPNLSVKELGGTGRVHNWNFSRKICESIGLPVFLAGGLNPDNVRKAVEKVKPYGLDICSGLRTNGKLDRQKVNAFFTEINN